MRAAPVADRGTAATPVSVDGLSAYDLLSRVRAERAVRDAADVRLLELAVAWAERHTIDPAGGFESTKSFLEDEPGNRGETPEEFEWLALPTLRWDTAASFAAALGMSTTGGKALIRDALVLGCRMPLTWARVLAGDVAAWRARRIAQAVLGEPDDVVTMLDATVAPCAGSIGPVLLDRALDEVKLRLHPEEREIAQLEALDARYARLLEHSINHTGITEFLIRGDYADVAAFDDTVAAVAAALKSTDGPDAGESLDVRRSIAVGILADPAAALALLARAAHPAETSTNTEPTEPTPEEPATSSRRPSRRIVLNLDLHPAHLAGLDPVVCDSEGRAHLDQVVRAWCGRDDTQLFVRPIRHCGGCADCPTPTAEQTTRYTPAPFVREEVTRRDRYCVFPYCTRPATSCEADHIRPFDHADPTRGGPSTTDNLALLCRHHHRLKTHAGWHYTVLEPGTYLWSDRYGQHFQRDRHGTIDLDR